MSTATCSLQANYLVIFVPCDAGYLGGTSHLNTRRVNLRHRVVYHPLIFVYFDFLGDAGDSEEVCVAVKIDGGDDGTLLERVVRILQVGLARELFVLRELGQGLRKGFERLRV